MKMKDGARVWPLQTDIPDRYVRVSLFVVSVQVIPGLMSVESCDDVFRVRDKLDWPKHGTLWYATVNRHWTRRYSVDKEITGPV